MARTRKTTAQRVAQRQRAKKKQEKPIPTHERLGVSRGGEYGRDFTRNLPKHSYPTYIYRMGRTAGQAENLDVLEYRKDQIHYGRNLAVAAKERAERQEREQPGSADPSALKIDLAKVERNKERALATATRREKELAPKPKKKPKKRKKKTAKKAKKKAKKRKKKKKGAKK
jgi:hypothetical protein